MEHIEPGLIIYGMDLVPPDKVRLRIWDDFRGREVNKTLQKLAEQFGLDAEIAGVKYNEPDKPYSIVIPFSVWEREKFTLGDRVDMNVRLQWKKTSEPFDVPDGGPAPTGAMTLGEAFRTAFGGDPDAAQKALTDSKNEKIN